MMKRCTKCGEFKEISEFNKDKSTKDGHQYNCRQCTGVSATKRNREVLGCLPMADNKDCALYLGVAVAERLVRHLFKDVVRMPNGNPGYDFICAKDKKIDVKSSCITLNRQKYPCWVFTINHNQIADYFLLLAFDNRSDLEPQHQWLIPADILNHIGNTSISSSTINKWAAYRQPIDDAQICCNTMRVVQKHVKGEV